MPALPGAVLYQIKLASARACRKPKLAPSNSLLGIQSGRNRYISIWRFHCFPGSSGGSASSAAVRLHCFSLELTAVIWFQLRACKFCIHEGRHS